ncbi:methyl-CpG-binding domain-containing protein 13-like [Euphorbia lathyris]|uniref:methyl-CpG-binding domain-containing protein 13-like n=1 Tax=Euphorbia lathyris TaxID=212925 RepID=UPI0033144AAB
MVPEDSTEGIPQGWTPHYDVHKSGRKVKYYMNSGTGQKFYSKADLMRYVKAQNAQLDQHQPTESPIERPSSNNEMHASMNDTHCESSIERLSSNNEIHDTEYTNERPEWLPHGWIMELKTRKSGLIKCYVDPTGCKFYSKPQVLRHLETVKQKSSTSKEKEMPTIAPDSKPEWLPDGWIMEIKAVKSGSAHGRKYKVYIDPSTGCKFFSQPEVFRHLRTVKKKSSTSEQKEMPTPMPTPISTSEQKEMPTPMPMPTPTPIVPTSKVHLQYQPEWLPLGWTVETKKRKSGPARGKEYKVYLDPSTGCKFFSKPEVFRYLKTAKKKSSTSEQKEMPISIAPTSNVCEQKEMPIPIAPTSNVATWKATSEDLPPGWIKEFRVRKNSYGTKKDPFYTDPASGYVFRSKRDVQRYLETGDINACAILPKKRDIEDESLPSSATKRQKLEHSVTSHQLFGEKGSSDVESVASPIAITIDISPLRRLRSPRDDDTETKENSNKNCSPPAKAEGSERNEDKNMSAGIEREERNLAQNSLSKSKNRKWLSLPRRCSTRLSRFESDMETNAPSIVQLSSEVDKKQGKNSGSGTEEVGSYETKTQNSLTKSKKALNSPLRSSKRLAGFEPEPVANSVLIGQSLPKTDRPPNDEATLAVGLNKGAMTQSEPIDELVLQTSSDVNKQPLLVEPSNESQGCDTTSPMLTKAESSGKNPVKMIDADTLPILTPEADMKQEKCLENVNKNNLRASRKKKEVNLPRRSSRRLACIEPETKANSVSDADGLADEAQAPKLIQAEHELETLHGEASNKNQPFLDAHAGSEDKLQTVEVGKSHDKKSESESIPPLGEIFSDPCLEFAFKTLTGELPVAVASANGPVSTPAADNIGERNLTVKKNEKRSIKGKAPISSKKSKTTKKGGLPHEGVEFQPEPVATSKNPARVSRKTGAFLGTGLAPNSSAVAPEAQQAHNGNGDKPEQQPFFSAGDSWSDPSLEFAFKTLNGSAALGHNIPGKSYFQQQVESSQTQREGDLQQQSQISQPPKDVSSTLPDYGHPNLFQTDVSVHFESTEQRLSSQPQMPVSFSSFSGIGGGFSSFSGIDSQPPPPIKNQPSPTVKKNRGRGRPRKVNP